MLVAKRQARHERDAGRGELESNRLELLGRQQLSHALTAKPPSGVDCEPARGAVAGGAEGVGDLRWDGDESAGGDRDRVASRPISKVSSPSRM